MNEQETKLAKVKDTFQKSVAEVDAAFTAATELQEAAAEKFNVLLTELEKLSNDDDISPEFLEELEDNVGEIWYSKHGTREGYEFWLASDHCW